MPIPDFVRDLRRHVGTAELWLPGVTAVVRRGGDVLLVQRSDTGEWAPVTGIVDPGEDPGVAARRDVQEETGVEVTVDRDVAKPPENGCFDKIELLGERTLAVTYRKDRVNAGEVLAALQREGLGIVDVTTREADLEDVFLNLTRATGTNG